MTSCYSWNAVQTAAEYINRYKTIITQWEQDTQKYTHCVPSIEIFVKNVTSITMINDDDNNNNNMIEMVYCKHMYIFMPLVRGPEAGQNGDG